MIDKQVIVNEARARKAANEIIAFLHGKRFFVVSVHSNHFPDTSLLENYSLVGSYRVVEGMCILPMLPKRSIAFEIAPTTTVTFDFPNKLIIERQLNARDRLKRIILVVN